MIPRLRIAEFSHEQLEAAACVWQESFESSGVPDVFETTLEDLKNRILDELDDEWDLYLGWIENTLVGFLALKSASNCLDQIFVAPSAQNQGIGLELLNFAKTKMPEGMWLKTHAENVNAHRFYERHRFRRCETKTDERFGYEAVIFRWP